MRDLQLLLFCSNKTTVLRNVQDNSAICIAMLVFIVVLIFITTTVYSGPAAFVATV